MPRKETCEYCHNKFSPAYLPTHWRTAHGIAGGRSGKPRGENKNLPAVVEPRPVAQDFEETPYKVLRDKHGVFWLAEPIGRRRA